MALAHDCSHSKKLWRAVAEVRHLAAQSGYYHRFKSRVNSPLVSELPVASLISQRIACGASGKTSERRD